MVALFAVFAVACGSDTKTETVTEEVPAPTVAVTGDVAIEVGATATFTATTADGEDTGYAWASSDEAVATVADGVVTGVAAGTAIIMATGTDTEASGNWGVHVYVKGTDPQPTPMVMASGPADVKIGETITLAATTVDGTDASYTWASGDEAIATVADGVVTGVAVGSVTITATGADTGKSGSWNVYVWKEGEVITPDAIVTVVGPMSAEEGETVQFVATTANGEDTSYTWTSDNEAAATVDADGLVTAVAAGEALITATGADTGAAGIAGIVVLAVGTTPEIPFEDLWAASGHADAAAEAFVHWDEDDPQEVPTNCAKCHSGTGYLDFLGMDGTDFGTVDNPAPIGTVVTCAACHNSATMAMDTVTFPSGAVVTGLGSEARCMQCHQGRESTVSVDAAIEAAAPVDDDTVTDGIGFKNVHYFAAGATLYGDQVKGAYQYADKFYQGKFGHEMGFDACAGCHNPHSLEVKTDSCSACHEGATVDEFRMAGSSMDYDGNGTVEGIRVEVEGLQALAYAALQDYAANTIGTAILYDGSAYPYFFIDTNANGEIDDGEATNANKYVSWSPRLLRAAYNLQYSLKDPGAFAHNPKYIIGILYETIADLGGDVSGLARFDAGHFDAASEAFRHWDGAGVVQASCSRCHSGEGFKYYAMNGQDSANAVPTTPGLSCNVCHMGTDYAGDAPRRFIASVTFPSGNTIDNDSAAPDDSFLCMSCHQGRESKTSVDEAIAAGSLKFLNVHYAPSGGTLYGSVAGVGYEYEGKTYEGQFGHYGGSSAQCASCHDLAGEKHTFHPEFGASCQGCHSEAAGDIEAIRKNRSTDYDGDGNTTEMLKDELAALAAAMYAEMQTNATAGGNPIIYSDSSYPYFFKDTNGNGVVDDGEATNSNKYTAWTADLMRAAFNLQFYTKETGAWAHNTNYVAQLLIDSIEALGGDVSIYNRP